MHATLVDSHVRILERVLRPIGADERDRYCRETATFAAVLGATPDDVPRTWAHLQDYLAAEFDSGRVTVGADARALAPAILRPPFGRLAWPLQSIGELVTIGSLPPAIRDGYGFGWNARRQRRQDRALAAVAALRAITPDRVARWPEARRGIR